MIKIEVQSTRAVIRYQAPLTVGLRGAKAQFTFGQDWDNLTKTAVFRQGDKTVAVADIGQEVTIPWEVLEVPGLPVQIGVHGIDSTGNIAIPTVWAETQPVRPGTDPEGDPSAEPTPGLWEQLQGKLGSLEQLDTSDQSSLVAAVNEANRAVFAVTVSGTEGNYSADCSMTDLLEAWKAGKTLLCLWKEHSQWMSVCRAFVSETGASTFDFSTVWGNQVYFIRMKGTTGTIAVSSTSRTGLATETSKLPNPEKLTFIGAATAEYDGSEEVVVGIPTRVSQLENDSGFMTKAPVTSVNMQTGAVKLPVPLRVTIEELPNGVIQSDPPYEELAEFRSEGHLLYCQHGNLELPLAAVTPHLYIFSCVQGGKVHTVMVGSSSVTVTATALASGGSGSGVDGITPHIGDNGNWFIGDTDTGMPSRGEDAPQEAVLYTPQELTDEQKAQARENIGASEWKIEVVLKEVGADLIDVSVKNVFDAVNAGTTVVLYRDTEDGTRIFYSLEERGDSVGGGKSLTFVHRDFALSQKIVLSMGGLLDGDFGSIGVGTEIITAQDVGAITEPIAAEIGQALCVKSVDENNKPTEWEAVDFPTGYEKLIEFTTTEDVDEFTILLNDEMVVKKLNEAREVILELYIPRDKNDTVTSTLGNVTVYVYSYYLWKIATDIAMIPAPTETWTKDGFLYIHVTKYPNDVMLARQTTITSIKGRPNTYKATTNAHSEAYEFNAVNTAKSYIKVVGTQNMITGTKLYLGVIM